MVSQSKDTKVGKPTNLEIHWRVNSLGKDRHMKHLYVIHPVIHQPEWHQEKLKRRVDWSLLTMIAVTVLYAAVAIWLA